jgi:hypothetical protein
MLSGLFRTKSNLGMLIKRVQHWNAELLPEHLWTLAESKGGSTVWCRFRPISPECDASQAESPWSFLYLDGWALGVMAAELVVKDDVEQGFVDADAALVLDEAELAKAVHEEADAGAGGADHFGEGFLGDGGDKGFGLAGLAEFGHEEEGAGEAFFAGVEELVDEVGLSFHAASKEEAEEEVGEGVVLVEGADHLVAIDLHGNARGDGGGGGHAQAAGAGDGFFADELVWDQQCDGGFSAGLGHDGELGTASDQIKDAIGVGPLREEDAAGLVMDQLSARAFRIKKIGVGKLRIAFGRQ